MVRSPVALPAFAVCVGPSLAPPTVPLSPPHAASASAAPNAASAAIRVRILLLLLFPASICNRLLGSTAVSDQMHVLRVPAQAHVGATARQPLALLLVRVRDEDRHPHLVAEVDGDLRRGAQVERALDDSL